MALQKSTQELLEKYWAAETSPEEEMQLRNAMKHEDNNVYAAYFRHLAGESGKVMATTIAPVKQPKRVAMARVMSIAAAVLVLVVAGFLIQRSLIVDMPVAATDSYDDPMEAYEETKQALLMVSQKLNSSREMAGEKLAKTQPYVDILK